MDFKRPPYETIADAQRKRQETLEKQLAEQAAKLADKDAELASQAAEIVALRAQLEAKQAEKSK